MNEVCVFIATFTNQNLAIDRYLFEFEVTT